MKANLRRARCCLGGSTAYDRREPGDENPEVLDVRPPRELHARSVRQLDLIGTKEGSRYKVVDQVEEGLR